MYICAKEAEATKDDTEVVAEKEEEQEGQEEEEEEEDSGEDEGDVDGEGTIRGGKRTKSGRRRRRRTEKPASKMRFVAGRADSMAVTSSSEISEIISKL